MTRSTKPSPSTSTTGRAEDQSFLRKTCCGSDRYVRGIGKVSADDDFAGPHAGHEERFVQKSAFNESALPSRLMSAQASPTCQSALFV